MEYARLGANLPEQHINQLTNALNEKDFKKFARIVIKESNQLHAICMDTYPSINYLNNHSRQIYKKCLELNQEDGEIVAYSSDAGFHVFLFTLSENKQKVLDAISTLKIGDSDESIMETIIETNIAKKGTRII